MIACAVPLLAPARSEAQQLTAADRARAVVTVWSEARYNFAYWDRTRADWDSALTATLEESAERQPDLQFYRTLRRMAALLGDGRTGVIPAPGILSRLGRPPLLLRSVEGRPFILDYAENDEMRIARPERLAEITAIQGVPAADWIRDSILPETPGSSADDRRRRAVERLLEGPKGAALTLQLRLPGGALRGASVTRSAGLLERWPLTPPAFAVDTLADQTVWIRLTSFEDPGLVRDFDRALAAFGGVKGLIIDLRDNDAGPSETGYQILSRLTDQPFATVRWRTPQYRPTRPADQADSLPSWFVVAPDTVVPRRDRPAYTGPIAVLTSPRTAAAAEDFVAAFRAARRGPVIGERTSGSPGRQMAIPLPRGWSFQVCVTRNAFPDGTEYAGVGIEPDDREDLRVEDLLAGRDRALERARAYLTGRR